MRTVVVNNQKGGVGKTLLAVHAAWYVAERGARVLFVDLDPQANASYSLAGEGGASSFELFTEAGVPPLPGTAGRITLLHGDRRLDQVDGRLADAVLAFHRNVARLSPHYDYCVIDTPPTWSGRNYAALLVAHTLVAPIDLETYALQGVKQLLAQKAAVERQARQGRPIDFLGLLPSRFQSGSPRQKQNLQDLIRQDGARLLYPDHGLITQRQGYAEALDLRCPVWTLRKTAAQDAGREIRAVLASLHRRLDSLSVGS